MTSEDKKTPWEQFIQNLAQWHTIHSRISLEKALEFIEPRLRDWTPVDVNPEDKEDLIQNFLLRLMEKRLPEEIKEPQSYLKRSFRNSGLDWIRTKRRKDTQTEEHTKFYFDTLYSIQRGQSEIQENQMRLQKAMEHISLDDRVIVKLKLAPNFLSVEEAMWLADFTGRSYEDLEAFLRSEPKSIDLALLIFPEEDRIEAPEARQRLLDRFSKRFRRTLYRLKKRLSVGDENEN